MVLKPVDSYVRLELLGRQRLSENFFMRDFLYSEIAAWHGMCNVPEFPDIAISSGRKLCTELIEPLQAAFGRVHIRSGYRSPLVNGFGNAHDMNCSSNVSNYAGRIWDFPDSRGEHGAMACIVIPWLGDHIANGGSWTDMAWWIHDHLEYHTLYFFPQMSAFNIGWHERPLRRIDSYANPVGCLTKPGMANHGGLHRDLYPGFPEFERVCAKEEETVSPIAVLVRSGSEMPDGEQVAESGDIGTDSLISYRAIHARNAWRKAFNHKSVASAIHGVNGAAGLFSGRARIDYAAHGDPLYVLVWESGSMTGYIVRPGASGSALAIVDVPVSVLLHFEAMGMADISRMEAFFSGSDSSAG